MSLETEIQNLTAAVENLAFIIKQMNVIQKPSIDVPSTSNVIQKPSFDVERTSNVYAPLRTDAEVKEVVKEVAAPVSVPEAVVQAVAVQMPELPTFVPPPAVPQATQSKAPFSDAKGLMDYLMKSYTTLGAEKGAKIQEVMKTLGATAVNEVKPEQYDALFAGVEALK